MPEENDSDSEHDFIGLRLLTAPKMKQIDTKIIITRPEKWYDKIHCVPYQPKKWYGICRVCRTIGAGAPREHTTRISLLEKVNKSYCSTAIVHMTYSSLHGPTLLGPPSRLR